MPYQRRQSLGYKNPYLDPSLQKDFNLANDLLNRFADNIFFKHDENKSGYLDVKEIYPAVKEVF